MIRLLPPVPVPGSSREQLIHVSKRFELKYVPAGIVEEHGHLLAGEAREAEVGFDDELHPCTAQPFGEYIKVLPGQDHAEVWNRNVVTIDRIMMRASPARGEVGDDLVAEKIKVDPFVAVAPLGAAQDPAIEGTRRGKIVDREGQMKRGQCGGLGGHGEHDHPR